MFSRSLYRLPGDWIRSADIRPLHVWKVRATCAPADLLLQRRHVATLMLQLLMNSFVQLVVPRVQPKLAGLVAWIFGTARTMNIAGMPLR